LARAQRRNSRSISSSVRLMGSALTRAVPQTGSRDRSTVIMYETACAACHGADLKGVTGLPDMPSGAALRLIGGRGTLASSNPVVTVESYWPYATTLFDYIRRAMPFSAPGSLSNDEGYAVTAYILAESNIIDKTTVHRRGNATKGANA
jgi:S-disulfanyl-L-cysteine oxidoreductase SoxD